MLAEGQKPVALIEVKASRSVSPQDPKGLRAFAEDRPRVRKVVVSLRPHARTTEHGVEIVPVEELLARLWDGAI